MNESAQLHGPPRQERPSVRELDDAELLRAIFDACDDASRLARESVELAISLDHLAGVAGERWALAAFRAIEDERLELEAERSARR